MLKLQKFLKPILFLVILFLLGGGVFKALWLDKKYLSLTVYDEPKNSLDIVYVGASNVYVYFNTTLAFDLYGYATGTFSTGSQPFPMIKYVLQETKKYQNPSLYIIDLARFADDYSKMEDGDIRRATDSLKFSANRIKAINEILSYKNIKKQEYLNYYFSFFLYHNRWQNINENDFTGYSNYYKGYILNDLTIQSHPSNAGNWQEPKAPLNETNARVLNDLINYIKENNLNVLFTIPVKYYNKNEVGQLKSAITLIAENNLEYLNFNTLADFPVDFAKDFYNPDHLNVYATTRYTLYFSKYLKEHYDLPNHQNDPNYKSWQEEYERFKKDFKKLTKKDFNKLLLEYQQN